MLIVIVPPNFFPFAIDAGGDYVLIDLESPRAEVYVYRHDTDSDPLIRLHLNFDAFWNHLTGE